MQRGKNKAPSALRFFSARLNLLERVLLKAVLSGLSFVCLSICRARLTVGDIRRNYGE